MGGLINDNDDPFDWRIPSKPEPKGCYAPMRPDDYMNDVLMSALKERQLLQLQKEILAKDEELLALKQELTELFDEIKELKFIPLTTHLQERISFEKKPFFVWLLKFKSLCG